MFKTIDRLVINSFWGPYLASFFVAEFVLLMQLLWKFVDEILGKGITFFEIMQLLAFFAVTIIPLSIPLTILISSVMVFGNMAEKYELASMKSAGVSLIRVMRAGIILAVMTALLSIASSSYLVPKANFEFHRRLMAIRKLKPSLTMEEGVFNDDFKGFVMRVGKKDKNGRDIEDVMVYDHTSNDKSLVNATYAEKGEMFVEKNGSVFVMNLKNGVQYREMARELSKEKGDKYPFMRTEFEEWSKIFDMSEFGMDLSDDNSGRNRQDLMSSFQLAEGIDSVEQLIDIEIEVNKQRYQAILKGSPITNRETMEERERVKRDYEANLGVRNRNESSNDSTLLTSGIVQKDSATQKEMSIENDSTPKGNLVKNISKRDQSIDRLKTQIKNSKYTNTGKALVKNLRKAGVGQKDTTDLSIYSSWIETIDSNAYVVVANTTATSVKNLRDQLSSSIGTQASLKKKKKEYLFKLNQHFSVALVCIIFLFIGAPLGSIVQKGGYGFPLLAAIFFYMIFMMTTIMSQKLIRSPEANAVFLAWLPCLILLPLSILLTWMALKDRKLKIPSFNFFKSKS